MSGVGPATARVEEARLLQQPEPVHAVAEEEQRSQQEEEAQSSPSSSGRGSDGSAAASGGAAEGGRWGGFVAWLSGRRRAQAAQRLPTDDGDEMQATSIAVVVEAAAEASAASGAAQTAGAGAASGSGEQQQQQQQQREAASGSGGGGEIEAGGSGGSPRLSRLPSRGPPTCLICLEEFTQEEFVNGSALRLDCSCRGDLALRHRDCVMRWVSVKGSNVCELCKAPIRNIPAPPPRPAETDLPALDEAYFNDPSHIHDFMPSSQDLVFDCIRVTWVACIISVLFFEMSLGAALWTGLLAGCAYSIMVRLMYRQHFLAMRQLAQQQAAVRRDLDGGSPRAGAHPVVAAV